MAAGKVYLVGAGPGDPELVTVKGLAAIARADVLVYDRLVSPSLVARARPGAELIYVGKVVGRHGRTQTHISRILVAKALEGKLVCRLKGGDPFIFGRGGEEADLLAEHGIPFEVVPGITSGVAAPAYAGIPVTHREHAGSVSLVTGHDAPTLSRPGADWTALAQVETLLIYMGVETLPQTAARLIAAGRPPGTPVAVISHGTLAEQRTVVGTLADIPAQVMAAGLSSPAMIIVGSVVTMRGRLGWAEMRPLAGRRILVPTTGEPAGSALERLRDLGAEVWEWPVAFSADAADTGALLASLAPGDTLLFAGAEAVRRLPAILRCLGLDLRALAGLTLGAVDEEAQEALVGAGLRADLDQGLPAGADGRVLVLGEEAEAAAIAARLCDSGLAAVPAPTHRLLPRTELGPLLQESMERVQEVLLPSARSLAYLSELLGPNADRLLASVPVAALLQPEAVMA